MKPLHTPAKRLRQLATGPVALVRGWFTPTVTRWVWRLLMVVSLGVAALGLGYAWRELPTSDLAVQPVYLGLAALLYALTFGMHLLGWQALATQFFVRLPLRDHAEAMAASNLVKYLPTIGWYIASRVHRYTAHQVPRGAVVAASLVELQIMMGSGGVLYALWWLAQIHPVLALAGAGSLLVGAGTLFRSRRWRKVWQQRVAHYHASAEQAQASSAGWLQTVSWYTGSWLLGIWFLWAVLHAFTPVQVVDIGVLMGVWLLAGLASYLVSVTLGSIGIVREITLVLLLARVWPFTAAVATAITIKLLLLVGEIVCSLVVLGVCALHRRQQYG